MLSDFSFKRFYKINVNIYKNNDLKITDKKEKIKLTKLDLKLWIDNFCFKIYKYQLFINNLEHI